MVTEEQPKYFVASGPSANDGDSKKILNQMEGKPGFFVMFTGYRAGGTIAERLVKDGCAKRIRWNSHPPLFDNVNLVQQIGAEIVIPAYASSDYLTMWQRAFKPVRVCLQEVLVM